MLDSTIQYDVVNEPRTYTHKACRNHHHHHRRRRRLLSNTCIGFFATTTTTATTNRSDLRILEENTMIQRQ